MYKIKRLTRRQINRNIKSKVDAHMREISNDFSSDSDIPISKKVKLTEASPNLIVGQSSYNVSDTSSDFDLESCSDKTCFREFNSTIVNDTVLSDKYESISFDPSASSVNEADMRESNLQMQLRDCFIKHNASHSLINDVLGILKHYHLLPNDARTLLKTPQNIPVKHICDGEYAYFGLVSGIKEKIKSGLQSNSSGKLNLSFNIDGLPLHKSSCKQFWPILCQIDEALDKSPFPVALFCGLSKPEYPKEFLSDFVDELSAIQSGNSDIGFEIIIKAFICDAPARAFIKCVKHHNGYFGCERCKQEGLHLKRMTYPSCDAPKRKDTDFHALSYDTDDQHIRDKSPLLDLNIGLVTQFPLDYMHLVCLGVMRKLLITWCRGPGEGKLFCSRDKHILSQSLTSFSNCIPSELPRKPRTLKEIDRWKATEFRMFILYLGPVVLKNVMPSKYYKHFLCLHVAIRILSSKVTIRDHLSYARELLVYFVNKSKSLYGPEFLVYNIHNLIHIVDDVESFGPLDTFSAFPFENYLGKLKRLLRTPNKPLQQLCRRIVEIKQSNCQIREIKTEFKVVESSVHKEGPTASLEGLQFKAAEKEGFLIKCNNSNDCVMLNNGEIIRVCNIILCQGSLMIVGQKFKEKKDFYSHPCSSSIINLFHVAKLKLRYKTYSILDVQEKGVLLPYKDGFVYASLVHTVSN